MATTETPTSRRPDTPLFKLVSDRLGRDPIEFIAQRRAQTPPVAFVRIANEILEICNAGVRNPADRVYLTHEVPRRWLYMFQGRPSPASPLGE